MKVLKIIFNVILYTILAVLVVLIGYLFVSKFILKEKMPFIFNYSIAVIATGSMVPTLNVNDVILVHKESDYQVNDIITFEDRNGSLITHRLIRIEGDKYYTKGDYVGNSEDPDAKTLDKIYGKVVGSVGGLGAILGFLQSPAGICLIITLVLVVAGIIYVVKLIKKSKVK